MDARPSLAGRALLAVALMIGFYLLALGISFVLLWLPYAELRWAHRLDLRLALFCLVGAGVILWSILPRPDRFEPPGPALEPADQPRLFAAIREVAGAVRQDMPREVYLVRDVNAWVTERGGVMGFGARRVMGLGLPLMQALSGSELRAVLAHEFGHYDGGDTKLGPWVYKTRAAIVRTLQGLGQHHSGLLQAPFVWYGNMFLRTTHAISRRQEYNADALASRAVGSRPLAEGLQKISGAAAAFAVYWGSEVVPVLGSGFRPPLAAGFRGFVSSERIARGMAEQVRSELEKAASNPYDTHPSLAERIEAVAKLPAGPDVPGDTPAIYLLDDVDGLERGLLEAMAGATEVAKLRPLGWDEVGEKVYRPAWLGAVKANAAPLAGVAVDDAAGLKAAVRAAARGLQAQTEEERMDGARSLVGAAVALLLAERGWGVRALPGEPAILTSDDRVEDPFKAVRDVDSGEVSGEAWAGRCAELGIAGVALAEAAGEGTSTV